MFRKEPKPEKCKHCGSSEIEVKSRLDSFGGEALVMCSNCGVMVSRKSITEYSARRNALAAWNRVSPEIETALEIVNEATFIVLTERDDVSEDVDRPAGTAADGYVGDDDRQRNSEDFREIEAGNSLKEQAIENPDQENQESVKEMDFR